MRASKSRVWLWVCLAALVCAAVCGWQLRAADADKGVGDAKAKAESAEGGNGNEASANDCKTATAAPAAEATKPAESAATPPVAPGKTRHMLELYAGAEVNGKPYPMGSDGYQGNYYNSGSDGFGETTMGISHTFASFVPECKAYRSAYYDCAGMFYFNLSMIPKKAKIVSAKFGVSATNQKTEYGNHPTGRERIPLKVITNPNGYTEIWEMAFLKPGVTDQKEENWDGASWRYWNQTKKQPWGKEPSKSNVPKGKMGDLSTAMGDTAAYISFNPDGKSMSYSDDMKATVQAWVDGSKKNWGFVADLQNCESPDQFGMGRGSGEFGQKKFRIRAGVLTGYCPEVDKRPRLIIEWDE